MSINTPYAYVIRVEFLHAEVEIVVSFVFVAFVSNISNNWDSFGFVLCKKAEATCFSFADEARKNVKTKTNGSNTSCIFHLSQIIVIERRVERNLDFSVTDKNFSIEIV